MKAGETRTVLCFQGEEYEMTSDEPTCGACGHFKPYAEGCGEKVHKGGCGFCPVWDHVRADELQRTAGPEEKPCDHWTPREGESR